MVLENSQLIERIGDAKERVKETYVGLYRGTRAPVRIVMQNANLTPPLSAANTKTRETADVFLISNMRMDFNEMAKVGVDSFQQLEVTDDGWPRKITTRILSKRMHDSKSVQHFMKKYG